MSEHNPPPESPHDPLRMAAQDLNSGAIHLLRGMREIDRRAGLTPARLSALSVVVFGGPCSLGTLAAKEGVAGPTMTRIVDGLVEHGLVQREVHPENGRMALIVATPDGSALMYEAASRRIAAITAGLETLPDADRDLLVAAAPILRQLAAVVRELSPG